MKLKITEKGILGEIDFKIEEEFISVFQIYSFPKRCGIGTKLVEIMENLALGKNIKSIIVPVTPSKEALSFWLKMGYKFSFNDDRYIANRILNSSYFNMVEIFDTDSGIILLKKILDNKYER